MLWYLELFFVHDSSSGERWEIIAELRNTGTEGDERIYGTFEKITEDNFLDAFNLRLAKGQESYVSHPVRSLAQAYVYRDQCQPFGIYNEDKMVGYVMVVYDYDIPEYDIWHMMIDASSQGKGYGSAALTQVIDYIETKPFGDSDRVTLTCKQENQIALKLYHRAGFVETGVEEDGEIELSQILGKNL